jgi:hypothetical protein
MKCKHCGKDVIKVATVWGWRHASGWTYCEMSNLRNNNRAEPESEV